MHGTTTQFCQHLRYLNGATIDLDLHAFQALFGGETEGSFDVEYKPLDGDDSMAVAVAD